MEQSKSIGSFIKTLLLYESEKCSLLNNFLRSGSKLNSDSIKNLDNFSIKSSSTDGFTK